jgi:hypothetical protein
MRRTRTMTTVATVVLGLAALTACSGSPSGSIKLQGPTAAPATPTATGASSDDSSSPASTGRSPATASAEPDPAAGAGQGVSAGDGCPANNVRIPAGASKVETSVDLDNDGLVDTLWLSDSRKGVRTHSGAVFSQPISNGGGPQVSIRAIDIDGVPVVMENGRQAYVSAVVDCTLVKTLNKQGRQYGFDLGFTAQGTNYGCATIKGQRRLVGLAVQASGTSSRQWLVEQTVIALAGAGKSASNGETKVVNSYGNAD